MYMIRIHRYVATTAAVAALTVSGPGPAVRAATEHLPSNQTSQAAPAPVVRVLPFRGAFRVTATWGGSYGHATPAIDFSMPIGTRIYATAAGNVDYVSTDKRNCNPAAHIPPGGTSRDGIKWCIDQGITGTRIRIRHDDGTFSMYVHLNRIKFGISASPSTRVAAGQLIGWSGNTGISSGPHLHYSKINSAQTATVDPIMLRACWGTKVHAYTNLKLLAGKIVRNDNHTCST